MRAQPPRNIVFISLRFILTTQYDRMFKPRKRDRPLNFSFCFSGTRAFYTWAIDGPIQKWNTVYF